MRRTLATALFTLLPLSLAADIPITVGDGQLAFSPSIISADVGDTLSFSFYPRSHSVVQSSFSDPCHPLASGGFFSGFQPLSAGPGSVEFVVEVNDTDPIWIYCSQTKGSHCQNGMAMVVNPPAPPSPDTLAAYQLAAANSGNSTSPSQVAGGIFVSRNSTSTTGRNSAASSTGSSSVPYSSVTVSGNGSGFFGSGTGSGTGSGPGGSNSSGSESGSGSGSGSGSTTSGTSQSSPIVSFKGAASKTVTGLGAAYGAAALIVFAMV